MTEPRPRLTSTIGSVQQITVVSDDVSPSMPTIRSHMIPSFAHFEAHLDPSGARGRESDQQTVGMEMRRIVRTGEQLCPEPAVVAQIQVWDERLHDDRGRSAELNRAGKRAGGGTGRRVVHPLAAVV